MSPYTVDQLNASIINVRIGFDYNGLRLVGVLEEVRHEYGAHPDGSTYGATTLRVAGIDGTIPMPSDVIVEVFE